MSKEPFRRYETLAGVEYEVLSSDQEHYYKVPMLGLQAIACPCKFAHYNPTCKHQLLAEREEAIYQEPQLRLPVALSPCKVISENQPVGFVSLAGTLLTFTKDARGIEKAVLGITQDYS